MTTKEATKPQSKIINKKLVGKKILVVLPHYNFRDKEYTWLRERFDAAGIHTEVASTHLSEAQGRFGTIVCPDVLISYVEAIDYDAYVFVGEEAASEFYGNRDVQRIIEKAFDTRRVIAAIGAAVPIIGFTGKLVGKRVTSVEAEKNRLQDQGAFFTGKVTETDGSIITAAGPYGTREFAESILEAIEHLSDSGSKGRQYLR